MVSVPRDRLGDLAATEVLERCALCRIVLADVLVEDVDGRPVPIDERLQSAACVDGVELAVVADDNGLGARAIDGGEELEHRLVVGHAERKRGGSGKGV